MENMFPPDDFEESSSGENFAAAAVVKKETSNEGPRKQVSASSKPKGNFYEESLYDPDDDTDYQYYCDVCSAVMNSIDAFRSHYIGKKHKKKVDASKYMNKDKKANDDITVKYLNVSKAPSVVRTYQLEEEAEMQCSMETRSRIESPVIGLDYVYEIHLASSYGSPVYKCVLCPADCQKTSIFSHVTGSKHRLSYMRIGNPYEVKRLYSRGHCREYSSKALAFAENIVKIDGCGKMIAEREISNDDENAIAVETAEERRVIIHPPSASDQAEVLLNKLNTTDLDRFIEMKLDNLENRYNLCSEEIQELVEMRKSLAGHFSKSAIETAMNTRPEEVVDAICDKNYRSLMRKVFSIEIRPYGEGMKDSLISLTKKGII